jgi:hypothetical protein
VGKGRRTLYNAGDDSTGRRLTVNQTADVLGTTPEAIRGRIRRRTIAVEGEAGRVYVVLDTDQSRQTTEQPTGRTQELIATLREQLQTERRANEENRRIIAALPRRLSAIESPAETPQEPPESPTTATEQPGRVEPQPQVEGAQEGTERVSWWRRMFGG